jgi:GT2 family glycosyltransferase
LSKLSLVIVTRNRAQALLRCVELALALPERPQVIVVDNASVDATARKLKDRFPQVKLVRVPFDIGAAARNLGVECAETPYVAFGDDATQWVAGSLRTAADILDFYPRIAAVTARVLLAEGREDPLSAHMSKSPLPARGLPGPALLGFHGCASVLRRKAFIEVGGYEPRFFDGGEETLLAYDLAAAGWSMLYSDRMTVHYHPTPPRDARARERLLARNALWVAWLRRPLGVALRRTAECLQGRQAIVALLDALGGLGWILRERRVMPRRVEELCLLLEQQALRQQRFGVPRPAL